MKLLADHPRGTHVVVVGAGTMGADVATVMARGGAHVIVVDPSQSARDAVPARVHEGLQLIGLQRRSANVMVVPSIDAVSWDSIDLVVECVPEVMDMKRALFGQLVQCCAAHTVLASNSSSFPISRIAEDLPTRERMLGLHFFMPAHLVPLVEVVLSDQTDPRTADLLCAYMRGCGSVPVMVRKDKPGFLANRLQHALAREAFAMMDEGVASAEDIDAAVRFGFGFRYLAAGPALQRDHAGLDVHCAAAATMYPSLCNASEPSAALRDRVAAGRTGMKAGAGFYGWPPERIATERQRYNRLLQQGLQLLADELPPIDTTDQPEQATRC